jgi:hypothetical protein
MMPLLGWASFLFTSWNVIMRWAFDLVCFTSLIKWLPPTFPRRQWARLGPQAFIRLFQIGIPTHASFILKQHFWDGFWTTLKLFSFGIFYKWIPTIVSTLFSYRVLQPHFEGSVRSPLTFPKMGVWSPSGLPKIQKTIAGVKTPCIEVFFILLERSWSVDVQNGLAWVIWTSSAQVKGKRRAGSQIDSRPLKVMNRPALDVHWGSAIWCWKALGESYNIGLDLVLIGGWGKKLWPSKIPGVQTGIVSGLHFGSPGTKSHSDVASAE